MQAVGAQLASIPSIAEALAGTGTVCAAGSKRQYYGFLATLGTRTRGIVINPQVAVQQKAVISRTHMTFRKKLPQADNAMGSFVTHQRSGQMVHGSSFVALGHI